MNHIDPQTGQQMTHEDHIEFLNAEYFQAILYAPDSELKQLKSFIEDPNEDLFICTAQAMRRSL